MFVNLFAATAVPGSRYATLPSGYKLFYKVVRPDLLHDAQAPYPLAVLHGGPQVPSDYLFDLEMLLPERSILFYDQLGSGRSDAPPDPDLYSVEKSVADLRCVFTAADLGKERPYHLYGQSWGGLLAFQHLTLDEGGALPYGAQTLTLSNTPSSVPLVEVEAQRLLTDCDGDVEAFMAKHNYRGGPEQPPQLAAAYAHAGTTWRGSGVIAGLEASPAAMDRVSCPALVLRGEHDFVTAACVKGWEGLKRSRFVTLPGLSHHALLEDRDGYLQVLGRFLEEHDPS